MTSDSVSETTIDQQRHLAFSYVRFSSEKQRQGASLERQTEAAKRWADENGYVLDTSLNMQDLGVSAYKGDNATTGALSGFLKAIEAGHLVEALDEALTTLKPDLNQIARANNLPRPKEMI